VRLEDVWLFDRKPQLSKRAERRLACVSLIYNGPMKGRDGRERPMLWLRFDVGRFLDRSKYNGDGTRK